MIFFNSCVSLKISASGLNKIIEARNSSLEDSALLNFKFQPKQDVEHTLKGNLKEIHVKSVIVLKSTSSEYYCLSNNMHLNCQQ